MDRAARQCECRRPLNWLSGEALKEIVYLFGALEDFGRLGNQLWQIAATIAAARRSQVGPARALVKPSWQYRPFFQLGDQWYDTRTSGEEVFFDLCRRHRELGASSPYFQELRYLEGAERIVRELFAPSRAAAHELERRYARLWRNDHREHVALHVRRGDYLIEPEKFPQLTERYYREAVSLVDPESHFLVFSDDIAWCRENRHYLGLGGEKDVQFVDGVVREWARRYEGVPQDQYDLFLMRKCQRHIISNSTFAWWGAYLSDDPRPICPNVWFGAKMPDWERSVNCLPAQWIRVAC